MCARCLRFNTYLVALVFVLFLAGCASSEERERRKEASSLQLYIESEFDTGDKTGVVPIYRASPVMVRVEKVPVLDEGYLVDASVVDVIGGFAIMLKYDFHGRLVLENLSNSRRGSRLAIYTTFTESRWLAAPRLSQRITDGTLVFTPDATREEAERIVRGLNNVAIKLGNKPKPGKEKKANGA